MLHRELALLELHPLSGRFAVTMEIGASIFHGDVFSVRITVRAMIAAAMIAGCDGDLPTSQAPASSPPDDTAFVQALVDKGGVVRLEDRVYHLTHGLVIRRSNTTLVGVGNRTLLAFTPSLTPKQCPDNRVIATRCDFDYPPPRRIASPISIGDKAFVATNAADVQDVQVGDWLLINDYDSVIGDRVAVDWVEVESTSGLQINVTQPFRMSFTNARPWVAGKSGLGFERITPVVENTELRDFTIIVDNVPGAHAVGISIFGALNTVIDRVSVTNYNGQPLYCYLAKGLTVTNSRTQGGGVLSEFASSVDITIQGNHFRASGGPGFGLDLGLGFFNATDNDIDQSANVGLYVLYAVHDGKLSSNQIARVGSTALGDSASGLLVWGSQNIIISDNYLAGGYGSDSVGISVRPYNGELPEPDTDITLTGNTITGFATAVQGP